MPEIEDTDIHESADAEDTENASVVENMLDASIFLGTWLVPVTADELEKSHAGSPVRMHSSINDIKAPPIINRNHLDVVKCRIRKIRGESLSRISLDVGVDFRTLEKWNNRGWLDDKSSTSKDTLGRSTGRKSRGA